MSTKDVILKPVDPVRVAEMTATAATFETAAIGPVIQALYPRLMQNLSAASIQPTGYGIAYYEPNERDDSVIIHAGIMVGAKPLSEKLFHIVELPNVPTAATLIHSGSMDHVEASYQELGRWIEANGYRSNGFAREVYLDYDPENADNGVTELQIPVEKA